MARSLTAAPLRTFLVRQSPLLLVALLWELLALSGAATQLLPRFSTVAVTVGDLLGSARFWEDGGASLLRVALGFAAAVLVGISAGLLMARVRAFELGVKPLVTLWYPVPVPALFPVLAAILALGNALYITIIVLGAVLPVVVSTYQGAKSVDKVLIWSALNLGTSPRRLLWKVVLPAALPEIVSGVRTALALSFVLLVAAEQLAARSGLGAFTLHAGQSGNYPAMFAGILIVGVLGFAADRLFLLASRRLLRGREPEGER